MGDRVGRPRNVAVKRQLQTRRRSTRCGKSTTARRLPDALDVLT